MPAILRMLSCQLRRFLVPPLGHRRWKRLHRRREPLSSSSASVCSTARRPGANMDLPVELLRIILTCIHSPDGDSAAGFPAI